MFYTKQWVVLIALCLLFVLMLSACRPVIGSGRIISETRQVNDFSEIELTDSADLIITQTGEESLTVSADDNVMPLLITEVRGKRLVLGTRSNIMLSNATVRYEVTVASLSALDLSSSGNVTLTKLDGDQLAVLISGSGTIVASGKVRSLTVNLSGSGNFEGEELPSAQAKASVSGSGNLVVNASESLAANISGSGRIQYLGKPQVDTRISGSGAVSPK